MTQPTTISTTMPMAIERLRQAVTQLPLVSWTPIYRGDNNQPIKGKKLMLSDGQPVGIVSKKYKEVQHYEAFGKILDGIEKLDDTQKTKIKYTITNNKAMAWMGVMVNQAGDGINYGFRAINSYDGKSALRYDMKVNNNVRRTFWKTEKYVTLWGVREICNNGMKVNVPLEWDLIITPEEKLIVENLLKQSKRILHMKDPHKEIEGIQYLVEAMVLLEKPLTKMVNMAKAAKIENLDKAKQLITKYIGRKTAEHIIDSYTNDPDKSLWGLYNSVTFTATHRTYTKGTMEKLLDKSAVMLETCLRKPEEINIEVVA